MTKQEYLDWVTNNGEFSYSDRKYNVGLYSADYGFWFCNAYDDEGIFVETPQDAFVCKMEDGRSFEEVLPELNPDLL